MGEPAEHLQSEALARDRTGGGRQRGDPRDAFRPLLRGSLVPGNGPFRRRDAHAHGLWSWCVHGKTIRTLQHNQPSWSSHRPGKSESFFPTLTQGVNMKNDP